MLGGLERLGVFGELLEQGEGFFEGLVDCGFVLLELWWGWWCDEGDDVALYTLVSGYFPDIWLYFTFATVYNP